MTQPLSKRYSIADQGIILILFRFYNEKIEAIKDLKEYIFWLIDYFKKIYSEIYLILNSGFELNLTDEIKIKIIIEESFLIFLNKSVDF